MLVIETVAAAVAGGIASTPVIGVVIAVVIGAGIVYTADKCGLFDLLEVTEVSDNNDLADDSELNRESNHIIGENGTQLTSKSVWKNGRTERIDVENPKPGERPGQIHYHDANNIKYYYDMFKKIFYDKETGEVAPNSINELLEDENFWNGIQKGLKILGDNKMVYMNELMKNKNDNEINTLVDSVKEIVKHIKCINDCLVYDELNEINENKLDFEKLMMMYGDRTGYEIACNEIIIDDFFQKQLNSFLIILDREITAKFSKKVVIYVQEIENTLELRFHSFRENESKWLLDDLDKYDTPIVCYIS